jgi:hypothetical protein
MCVFSPPHHHHTPIFCVKGGKIGGINLKKYIISVIYILEKWFYVKIVGSALEIVILYLATCHERYHVKR